MVWSSCWMHFNSRVLKSQQMYSSLWCTHRWATLDWNKPVVVRHLRLPLWHFGIYIRSRPHRCIYLNHSEKANIEYADPPPRSFSRGISRTERSFYRCYHYIQKSPTCSPSRIYQRSIRNRTWSSISFVVNSNHCNPNKTSNPFWLTMNQLTLNWNSVPEQFTIRGIFFKGRKVTKKLNGSLRGFFSLHFFWASRQ